MCIIEDELINCKFGLVFYCCLVRLIEGFRRDIKFKLRYGEIVISFIRLIYFYVDVGLFFF